MIEEREPRSVWPWITACVLLPVLYVASFGPVCWLVDRQVISISLPWCIYQPLAFALANGCSDSVCDAMVEYGMRGSGRPRIPMALVLVSQEAQQESRQRYIVRNWDPYLP